MDLTTLPRLVPRLSFLNTHYQFVRNVSTRTDRCSCNWSYTKFGIITARSCMQSKFIVFIVNYLLVKNYQLLVIVLESAFCWELYFFVLVEIFLIENQQSATDDRRGPCLYVDSKTDGAYVKVTGCNETDEKQNWVYTLKGQIMVSLENNDKSGSYLFRRDISCMPDWVLQEPVP